MLITVLIIAVFAYLCNQLFPKSKNAQNTSHSIVVCVVEICGLCYQFSCIKNKCDFQNSGLCFAEGPGSDCLMQG